MPWKVAQAAMSGGGFINTLDFADDGTLVVTYDGGNCYIRNEATAQWDNLLHQDRLPTANSQAVWGQGQTGGGVQAKGINCPTIAIAPSNSNYIYLVARSRTTTQDFDKAQIWRSTNKGVTWVDTGKCCPLTVTGLATLRGMGPTMRVDPVNPLHVLCSDEAGAIYQTFDGFETMTCLSAPSGPLDGVLPSTVTTGASANGATALTFGSGTIPTEVSSPPSGFTGTGSSGFRWMSDVTDNLAMQTAMGISSQTATTCTAAEYPITGTGVETGDTIVFGARAGIAFDRSSSVVDGITQGIYIGWGYGADAIYRSEDGGATFSAMTGSPSRSVHLACSHDGVLYVLPFTGTSYPVNHPWRYVNSSGTGGLTADTWTELSTAFPSSVGNNWQSVAADPNNAGRVSVIRASGGILVSNNYGTAAAYTAIANTQDANYNGIGYPRTSTDAPALGPYVIPDGVSEPQGTIENSMSHGQSRWDPVVSGRLWFVEGIGIWYCSPPTSGTNVIVPITGFNKNQQSIILNQMIKAPGGTLLASCQDRGGYRFLDPTVEPEGNFPIHLNGADPLLHCWGIDYAKDDINFLVLAKTGGIYTSTTEGRSWSATASALGNQCMIACQTTLNFVVFPNNATSPQYTLDGGATWTNCSFGGSTINGNAGWGGNLWNRHSVTADLNDIDTYYAYNVNGGANGGLWRSQDSGANWTRMRSAIEHPTVALRLMNDAGIDFCLRCVPGFPDHLFIGPGTGYNDAYPLMFSDDAGLTWSAVGGTGITWTVAIGKELPGASYPAIYTTGFNADDAAPSDPGIFVCTDFNPASPSAATWERICRAPAGNMDRPRDLVADQDRYGRWYMPTGGTGYVYGEFGFRSGTMSFGA
jgi:hypothetical protein